MSKMPGGKLDINVKIDGMKDSMDQLLAFCREMADKETQREEKRDLKETEDRWAEEKEIVKSEFDRVGNLLKKAKPGTDEYYKLTESLYKLKNIIGYDWN